MVQFCEKHGNSANTQWKNLTIHLSYSVNTVTDNLQTSCDKHDVRVNYHACRIWSDVTDRPLDTIRLLMMPWISCLQSTQTTRHYKTADEWWCPGPPAYYQHRPPDTNHIGLEAKIFGLGLSLMASDLGLNAMLASFSRRLSSWPSCQSSKARHLRRRSSLIVNCLLAL